MALLHFHQLGFDKGGGVALQAQPLQDAFGGDVAAADKAGFEKGGVAGDVFLRALTQFGNAAHFDGGGKLHIPQCLHETGHFFLPGLIQRLGGNDG